MKEIIGKITEKVFEKQEPETSWFTTFNIVAGIILGMLENVAAGYLDPLLPGGGLAQVFPFFMMIIVLVFRPHGLFGLAHIERV